MSPPCQPFCRTGLKQGLLDARSSPLSRVMELLPSVNFQFIFVENVAGFEKSDAHDQLVDTLVNKCGFDVREFLLSPTDLGIPNSRLRYYLLGKLTQAFKFGEPVIMNTSLPENVDAVQKILIEQRRRWGSMRRRKVDIPPDYPPCVGDVLEEHVDTTTFGLPLATAEKYWKAVDIVNPSSTLSCCFTKAYHHYLTGTGSLLDCTQAVPYFDQLTEGGDDTLEKIPLEKRQLRFFTPTEVARLLCYPDEFSFPTHLTIKSQYKALGNSVNVTVIASLLALLFCQ